MRCADLEDEFLQYKKEEVEDDRRSQKGSKLKLVLSRFSSSLCRVFIMHVTLFEDKSGIDNRYVVMILNLETGKIVL